MNLEGLRSSIRSSTIITKGEYRYMIHPLLDGFPKVPVNLMDETTSAMVEMIKKFGPFDQLITMEAMGIPLATLISQKMDVPYAIIRKRRYGLDGEIKIDHSTGYSSGQLYMNGISSCDRVVIVDDVLSHGGTIRAVLTALRMMDVTVAGVCVVVDKGDKAEVLATDFGVDICSLVQVEITDDGIFIKEQE